jgi:hypothetical protein
MRNRVRLIVDITNNTEPRESLAERTRVPGGDVLGATASFEAADAGECSSEGTCGDAHTTEDHGRPLTPHSLSSPRARSASARRVARPGPEEPGS